MTQDGPTLRAHFETQRGDFLLDASFEAPMLGVTALFGPSGSGKTTVLRAIAGLERLAGDLFVGPETWQDPDTFRPPHRRPVGYVFQEPSLFRHLDVRQNLLFGLRRTLKSPAHRPISADEVIELMGLSHLLSRRPHSLSGGERQRVAIGRALLSQPRLMLMDEPLTGLDLEAKDQIMLHLEMLHDALSIPVLLVSHDMAEVERLADRLVVMSAGTVAASGPLNEVLTGDILPLRSRRDAAAVLRARMEVYEEEDGLSRLDISGQSVWVAGRAARPGEWLRVRIAARDISLAVERPSKTTILNTLFASISAIEPHGEAEATILLALGADGDGPHFVARVTGRSVRALGLRPGIGVYAQLKSVSLVAGPATL